MSVFLIARELKELSLTADQYPQDAWLLITNMAPQDIREVEQGFVQRDRIIAFDTNIGYWMIVGAGLADLPTSLRQRLLPLHRYLRSSWPLAGQGRDRPGRADQNTFGPAAERGSDARTRAAGDRVRGQIREKPGS